MSLRRNREWSLVFFTLLTQLAVGTFAIWALGAVLLPSPNPLQAGMFPLAVLGTVLCTLIVGALIAASHLGRFTSAAFSLSNLRSSWLSREALLTIGFGLIVVTAIVLRISGASLGLSDHLIIIAGWIWGFSLVFGIAQLYRLRTVPAWNHIGTTAAFFTTSMLTGTALFMMLWLLLVAKDDTYFREPIFSQVVLISNQLITLLVGIQIFIFSITVLYLSNQGGAGAKSVRILWEDFRLALISRWLILGIGVTLLTVRPSDSLALFSYTLLIISEILGRFLFYSFYQRTGY